MPPKSETTGISTEMLIGVSAACLILGLMIGLGGQLCFSQKESGEGNKADIEVGTKRAPSLTKEVSLQKIYDDLEPQKNSFQDKESLKM
eukprot:TRINITY_DN1262_c0_g1_i1.p1 TRINITY_DN1262_c0_g1~~TRINITY_DN1262_c0_g1_i1.p1  ORF type:complete len:89 (-),score=18.31 TRINITY_DN1262_c0_g1_i1:305-571(-)